MLASALLLASTIALPALASPVSLVSREFASYRDDIQIHESCNATQRRQLTKAVSDTMEVAQLVQNCECLPDFSVHESRTDALASPSADIVANGPTDPVFELYFGNDPSAYTAALGVYEGILKSNKEVRTARDRTWQRRPAWKADPERPLLASRSPTTGRSPPLRRHRRQLPPGGLGRPLARRERRASRFCSAAPTLSPPS